MKVLEATVKAWGFFHAAASLCRDRWCPCFLVRSEAHFLTSLNSKQFASGLASANLPRAAEGSSPWGKKNVFCVCGTVRWAGRKLRFSTFTTRLPVLCLPNSVSSWHQRQKVMLSGFLPFSSPPWFSQKISTDEIIFLLLPAPAIMESICLNYRLQQLFVLSSERKGKLSPLWVKVGKVPGTLCSSVGRRRDVQRAYCGPHLVCALIGPSLQPHESAVVIAPIAFIWKISFE